MSIERKSDFKLYNMGYVNPVSMEIVNCGEMRGWHARKFIRECEDAGVAVFMERADTTDSDITEFILDVEYENR